MLMLRLCFLMLLLACSAARADTPITLFKSYAGNLNFTGTQKTMRTQSNAVNACSVVGSGTNVSASLAGIPTGATVVSAQLYWAGSSTGTDYTINFDGAAVSAPAERRFTSNTTGSVFFSGAVDVTAQVAAKRNGTYTFSGLTIDSSDTYCDSEAVLGGFSLLVIYSLPSETYRVLNLYEGFQFIRTYDGDNATVSLALSNFKIPNPLGSATGRIGHITWEGDTSLLGSGEELRFNGVEMVGTNNPTGNQFNSYSNINNDGASYGIDFDVYTLSSPVIQSGQTTATTLYKSGQDLVLLSAEIIAVPNVPVADLQLTMTRGGTAERGGSVTYTQTASSLGPTTDTGPIVIRTTLASGLTFSSFTGTGWACSAASQVVTCSNPTALATGAALPPVVLTLAIAANSPSSMAVLGEVSGALYDNDTSNNAVEDKVVMLSDLQLAMSLGDPPLTLGQVNTFNVSISNNGPTVDAGPFIVSGTLPAQLRYISAAGDNWSCSAAGQALSCTYAGALVAGATAPPLTINVIPQIVAASVTFSMTVDGAGTDTTNANNMVTLTMPMSLTGWVFTDSLCTHARAFGNAQQACKVLPWNTQIGGTPVTVYLTSLNASGVPTRFSNNSNTSQTLYFALSCHNPAATAGTFATFGGLTLKACKSNGAVPDMATTTDWVSGAVTFQSGSPSSGPYVFEYDDVGRIEFYIRQSATVYGASGRFVMKPEKILLSTTGNGYTPALNHNSPVFGRAGATFSMTATATILNGSVAKNFGQESPRETLSLVMAAANDTGTGNVFVEMGNVPALSGSFGTFSAGAVTSNFSWPEVGILTMTLKLADNDYQGGGPVDDNNGSMLTVGRFIPNHFTTDITPVISCTAALNAPAACPTGQMHYAGQPMAASVSARALGGTVTQNFRLRFARAAELSAAVASGGAAHLAATGTLANPTVAATAFVLGVAPAAPLFNFPAAKIYNNAVADTGWGAPVNVFLRAIYADTPAANSISSLRTPTATDSIEAGTRVVAGRLLLAHGYGSERIPMRLGAKAQYWNGTAWANSSNDSVSLITPAVAAFNCTGSTLVCSSSLGLVGTAPVSVQISSGTALLNIKKAGDNNIGRAVMTITGSAWLPSSRSVVNFGIYRPQPVIYIREVF